MEDQVAAYFSESIAPAITLTGAIVLFFMARWFDARRQQRQDRQKAYAELIDAQMALTTELNHPTSNGDVTELFQRYQRNFVSLSIFANAEVYEAAKNLNRAVNQFYQLQIDHGAGTLRQELRDDLRQSIHQARRRFRQRVRIDLGLTPLIEEDA